LNKNFVNLKQELEEWEKIKKEADDLQELIDLKDDSLSEEIGKLKEKLLKKIEKKEVELFLSGKYDTLNALLTISAGAGGQDAEDWAAILLRMYKRYCERKGFGFKILSQSFGEPGPEGRIGVKEAVMEIKGKFAYGLLKGESGVHRLVRLSPFSAKNLRHTSFALVEIMPEIKEVDEVELKEDDLKTDTYRASGPGGQYVNKRDSAVRITHLPTKITVSCQAERTQGLNKKKALEMLKAKLLKLKQEEERKKKEKLKGKEVSVEWGNQIRSYVFYPYKLVKDHRTEVETSQLEDVLDGDLDIFIKKELEL